MSKTVAVLGAGVVLTFAFFSFYPSTQGHGWGYRYVYGMLGNLALLQNFLGGIDAGDVHLGFNIERRFGGN